MNFSFSFKDECELEYTLSELGDWAVLAFRLGYDSFKYGEKENRCITLASVPTREIFTAIVAMGAIVADASSFQGNGMLSWSQFRELQVDQPVYFTDRTRTIRGRLGGFNEEYQARTILDARLGSHFVTESNFYNYKIRFDSPRTIGNSPEDDQLVLEFFQQGLDLKVDENWLRTIHPPISLNIVKHNFIGAISDVGLLFKSKTIPLSRFLSLTESLGPGSGKILLKSEKNSTIDFNPKLAILSTASFERLIREYARSDLVIVLEHHEYDEAVASVARSLRLAGEDSAVTRAFTENVPNGVRLISKDMRREV
jgi:hypothetical protein